MSCCKNFGKDYEKITRAKYTKSNPNIYEKLIKFGDENKAIERSEKKMKYLLEQGISNPSQMIPCNTVYKLVEELNYKKNESK